MSDEQQKDNKYENSRTVGKLKMKQGQYGSFYEIWCDATTNKDGTPNTHATGMLTWIDIKTGTQYQIKQMKLFTPKNGMPDALAKQGFTAFVNIDLGDGYQVVPV